MSYVHVYQIWSNTCNIVLIGLVKFALYALNMAHKKSDFVEATFNFPSKENNEYNDDAYKGKCQSVTGLLS